MKFLSSTSSSSSSTITTTTTTSSFNRNSKNASAGCLGKILRRLLCFNTLPTHPFDHIKENDDEFIGCEKLLQCAKPEEKKVEASVTPGIVARLMGLESMSLIDLDSTKLSLNSTARSRSLNSMDSMRELALNQGKPRRVNSFSGAPTFLHLEDEKFFVFSFENEGKTKELRSKSGNLEIGFGELKLRCKNKSKRRHSVYEKNKENQDTNKVLEEKWNNVVTSKPSQKVGKVKDSRNVLCPTKKSRVNLQLVKEVAKQSKPINSSRNFEGGRSREKKKKKENNLVIQKVERECDSENSSPDSVLDFVEFPVDPEVLPTSEGNSRLNSSNTRRTLIGELKNSKHFNPCNSNNLISSDSEAKKIDGKNFGSMKKYKFGQNYLEMWGEVCKLAETDMKQSHWIYREKWKLEDFEHIGEDFELEILDQVLVDLVYQLVGRSQDSF